MIGGKLFKTAIAFWVDRGQQLQKTALFGMSFLVFLSFLIANFQALLWQTSDWLVGAVLPGVVATLTNVEREKYAAAPLSRSTVLDQAATMKAEHMAAEGYFAHESPGGITPWYWFDQAGYVYAYAGENLAVHFSDSDEVVQAWMNSPTHKANVIGKQYTEIGIGTAKGRYKGQDTVFVVQLFGTPAKRPAVASLPAVSSPEIPPTVVARTTEVTDEASTSPSLVVPSQLDEAVVPNRPEVLAEQLTAPVLSQPEVTELAVVPVVSPIHQEPGTMVLVPDEEVETNLATLAPSPKIVPVEEKLPTTQSEVGGQLLVAVPNEVSFNSFVATTSGLIPVSLQGDFLAGTTVPIMANLATKPRLVLQALYVVIGSIVVSLLLLSIFAGYQSHQQKTVLVGVGLLVLMSVLFMWHIAITGGAVVV